MIVSWTHLEGAQRVLIVALHPPDLLRVVADHIEIDLAEIPEAGEHRTLRILLTGPIGAEQLLKRAVEMRDEGVDVRYRGRPGQPDE